MQQIHARYPSPGIQALLDGNAKPLQGLWRVQRQAALGRFLLLKWLTEESRKPVLVRSGLAPAILAKS